MRQGGALDLEALRAALGGGGRITLAQALVEKVEVLPDFSKARALCNVVPDEYAVVAEVTFDTTGPEACTGALPIPNDLVLVAFVNPDEAFIIRRLSSKEDKIPLQISQGHYLAKALAGKKAYLASDTKVLLGKGELLDPSEPLVLGNTLVTALTNLVTRLDGALAQFDATLQKIITGPIGMGNLGSPVPTNPALITDLGLIKTEVLAIKTALDADKTEFLDTASTNIVSQLAFTERGS